MRRLKYAGLLLGLLFNGCALMVDADVEPAPIRSVQFLRPTREGQTGTWIPNWVEPQGFEEFTQSGQ